MKIIGVRRSSFVGFSLLELCLVLCIVMVIAGLALTSFAGVLEKGRDSSGKASAMRIVQVYEAATVAGKVPAIDGMSVPGVIRLMEEGIGPERKFKITISDPNDPFLLKWLEIRNGGLRMRDVK